MKPSWKGLIPDREVAYIHLLLEQVDPAGKEAGLERLCAWHRRGYRLREPHAFQQLLNSLLYSEPKVRRWALNAIALFGTKQLNLQPTLEAIERNRQDTDILAAGVAALVALTQPENLRGLLKGIDVPLEGPTLLAAAQQSDMFYGDIAAKRVNIERADPSEVRLSCVLLGLGKAPEHMFSLDHLNQAVIGTINRHDDPLAAQYSVWALCENDGLGLNNLGINLKHIESLPPNVRGYVYRLIAADASTASNHREYVMVGSEDLFAKAREGLAAGLRPTYFDGLDEIVVPWWDREATPLVAELLLDHMAVHSERSAAYKDTVLSAYERAASGSMTRARLEAATERTGTYSDLRRIALRSDNLALFGEAELGAGGPTVVNITGQQVNIGTVAGRDANVSGDVNVQQHIGAAQESLGKLAGLLEKQGPDATVEEGKKLVAEAAARPEKGTLTKVVEWMRGLKDVGGYAVTATASFGELYHQLHQLIQNWPS